MPSAPRPRITLSVRVDADLAKELRRTCRDHAGAPLYLTLSTVVETAITEQLRVLRQRIASPGDRASNHTGDSIRR